MISLAWIEMLYKRGHGLNVFSSKFLFRSHKEDIREVISIEKGFIPKVRTWVANRPVFQAYFQDLGLTELNESLIDAETCPTSAQAPKE